MSNPGTPTTQDDPSGRIRGIAGAVITVQGLVGARLYDVVHVGREQLIGEIIRLNGTRATVQVYEDTTGLRADDPVEATGSALQVELGPGLLGGVFDGIQRPLPAIRRIAISLRAGAVCWTASIPGRSPLVQPATAQPGDVRRGARGAPPGHRSSSVPPQRHGETIREGEFRRLMSSGRCARRPALVMNGNPAVPLTHAVARPPAAAHLRVDRTSRSSPASAPSTPCFPSPGGS